MAEKGRPRFENLNPLAGRPVRGLLFYTQQYLDWLRKTTEWQISLVTNCTVGLREYLHPRTTQPPVRPEPLKYINAKPCLKLNHVTISSLRNQ